MIKALSMKKFFTITLFLFSLNIVAAENPLFGTWNDGWIMQIKFSEAEIVTELYSPTDISIVMVSDYTLDKNQINTTLTDIKIRPLTKNAVKILNKERECGSSTWKLEKAKSVGNCLADGSDDDELKLGRTLSIKYSITNNQLTLKYTNPDFGRDVLTRGKLY